MRQRLRQRWLTRLVKKVLAWLTKLFGRSNGRVEQRVTGDRNTVIGIIETGSTVTITYGQSPLPTGEPNPFGVPYQRNRYFTGRQAVLERLHQQLNQETAIAITQVQAISGLGGIGKTQTAVEYAYRYHYDQHTYDTVFWVKADTVVNLATDFADIANQLALLGAEATQSEKIPAVQAWLSTHDNWLLIFDNADTPAWLTGFMPPNPKGKVLITSRASVFDQLGIRTPLALDVLSVDEAVMLLFERTGYERTQANITAATEINQVLGGLPLALEQASAFIVRRKISFAAYLKTYRKRGLFQLEKEQAKTGQYPSSVRQTWTINVESVTEENPAATALLELSAFLAPDEIPYCILTAGATHLGAELSAYLGTDDEDDTLLALSGLLALLSQYSLVKWDNKQQIYNVHRLVQAVVRGEMSQITADNWLEQATVALAESYPGGEFKHWGICAQLLPHWLTIVQQAQQMGYKSEALGALLNQAGVFLKGQGRYRESEPLTYEALRLNQRLLGEEHPSVADSLNNLAELYKSQGRYKEAEPLLIKALEMRQQLLGRQHPAVANSINNLAELYYYQGRYEEAEPLFLEALEMNRQLLDHQHPAVANSINNLAWLYKNQGRYEEAEPLLIEALEMRQQLLGHQHPAVANSINNLALLYQSKGRYEDAEPLFRKALKMNEQLLGHQHPTVANSLSNLAWVYKNQGRYEDAEPLYIKALKMNKQLLDHQHPAIASSLNNLALLYQSQGRYEDAKPLFREALEMGGWEKPRESSK